MNKLSSHMLHTILNPIEAQIEDEVRLEHYMKDVLPLKTKLLSYHTSMDEETFDYVESMFIKDYFNGDQEDYNLWVKENYKYFKEDK